MYPALGGRGANVMGSFSQVLTEWILQTSGDFEKVLGPGH